MPAADNVKSTGRKLFGTATRRVLAALDRADEIGGEIRDFIQERVLVDDRYVALRRRIDSLRGKTYVSAAEREAAEATEAAEAAAAAPEPGAALQDVPTGLGDPTLPAQIYGTSSCPWTGRAITLLEKHKVDYDFVDMDEPEHTTLQAPLISETKQNTVPYVYLRGQFIGGFNALSEVERLGQLEYALMSEEERKSANPAMKKIEIAARPNSDEVAPGESANRDE